MARKHSPIELKRKICEAHRSGQTIAQLAKTFDCHRNSISRWVKRYRSRDGLDRLAGSGRHRAIGIEEGRRLLACLLQPASDYGYETDLWTITRLMQVAKKELGISLSRMCIHRLLSVNGYSFKLPRKRYYEADVQAQDLWLRRELPKIMRVVREKKAILYFEDESCISLTPVVGRTWGPIGQKTIQRVTGNRGSISAISAISRHGHLLFALHDSGKRYGAADIISFLQNILDHHPRRHIVVIMDRAPCHTAKAVREFVDKNRRLHVFYLPPRSPEFNPDEQVWSYLKQHALKSHMARSQKSLKKLARKKLSGMARKPRLVRGLFQRSEFSHIYL
jgi:transposase